MDFNERREKFLNRFGICTEYSVDEAKQILRNGILNHLHGIDFRVNENEITQFCSWFGFKVSFQSGANGAHGDNLFDCITKEQEWEKYLFKIESLFSLNFTYNDYSYKESNYAYKQRLFNEINNLFKISNLSLTFIKSNNDYIICPAGAKFLDDELIIKILKFLNDEAHHHFIQALQFYSEKNNTAYIKSAESMRRVLEEYLRYFFNNTKGLEANIKEVGKVLKQLSKQKQIKDIIHNFFGYLDTFYNENTKHNDGDVDESECELIILQTGLLLKYLNWIKQNQ